LNLPGSFHFPDPIVTANVYASGMLDDIMRGVLVPFRRELEKDALGGRCFFWVVRYSRNGEHLKVRVHGSPEDEGLLRRMLERHTVHWLDSVNEIAAPGPRKLRTDVPPIDPEERTQIVAPDRSLLWTTPTRSPVSLGSGPWLDDDAFAARACETLACGCGFALDAMEATTVVSASLRQKLLIKALLAGLPAVNWREQSDVTTYLEYHRDWLLRFFIDEESAQQKMLQQFDEQIHRMINGVGQLRHLAQTHHQSSSSQDGRTSAWTAALADLSAFLNSFQGRPGYQVDPFTSQVSFPPLFKVFHGLANQLGLKPMEEAYVHQLVLVALSPGPAEVEISPAGAGVNL
jgi:hypothetical protein